MFVWERLRSRSVRHSDLPFIDEVNQDLFKKIVENHQNEWAPVVKERMQALQVMMENAAWSRSFVPHQKKLHELADGYGGDRYIGRSYGSPLVTIPSKIVNTLFKDTHRYLDATACFPTILLNVGGHLDVDALREYVVSRDEVFTGFLNHNSLGASTIKTAINAMIGSCPRLPVDFGLGVGRDDDVRTLSEHPFIIRLQADLQTIANEIKMEYPDFYAGVEQMCIKKGKTDNIHGVVLSYFCQDVEDACMRTVVKHMRKDCDDTLAKTMVWKFDGIMIPKSLVFNQQSGEADDETFLQSIQAAVYSENGLHMRFTFKDIASPREAYQDCGVDIIVSAYQKWKKRFDMRYVKFMNPPRYGKLREDGTYQLLSYGQGGTGGDFGFQTMEENQDFVKQWSTDPDKRIYQGMCFAPPPAKVTDGYLNTYRGMAGSRLAYDFSEEEIMERIKPFVEHVNHIANGDTMSKTFFIKYLAHLLQKPGVKTEKIVFIRSIQGTGKDQLLKFIESMIGEPMVHKQGNVKEVKGQNSGNLENKILLVLSECGYKDFQEAEFLKQIATRTRFTVQTKYVPEYTSRCFINLWMFSNQFHGMGMDMDNRRFFVMEANPRIANVPEYHVPFDQYINNDENQYAVYKYLTSMDLGNFFPGNADTKTRIMKVMATQTFNYAAWFLKDSINNWKDWADNTSNDYRRVSDDFIKISSSAFLDALRSFAEKMKMEDKNTTQKVSAWATALFTEASNKMAKFCPENVVAISNGQPTDRFRIGSGRKVRAYTLYIPAIEQFIHETTELAEDVEQQDDQDGGAYAPGFRP